MAILTLQSDILREVQTGGLLRNSSWLASSFEQSDFLLASIIVCLELCFRAREVQPPQHIDGGTSVRLFSKSDLLEALRTSHHFLDEFRQSSSECQQAFDMFSFILKKLPDDARNQEVASMSIAAARSSRLREGAVSSNKTYWIRD
jgi:hypothetical protein